MAVLTGFYAGLCGFLIIALAFLVVRFRRTEKVGIGSAGKHHAEVLIRAHANAVEYVPIALLLLLAAELNGLSATWMHLLGSLLVISRLLHAVGLIAGNGGYHKGRFLGTLGTWITIIILSVVNVFTVFKAM